MCDIGLDELLTTPISESSEFSYGPWLGSPLTTLPLLVTVIRNWHPELTPTGGHCVNCGTAVTVAVSESVASEPLPKQPAIVTVPKNEPFAAYVWVPETLPLLALYLPEVVSAAVPSPQSILTPVGVEEQPGA